MKNVGKKAVRNCNLTAVKCGENAEFVGANALNGASFAGLRSVGFAILNGGGGCPLDKVKLKDNCKFCLQSELFNSSQELSHHQTATRWQSRTHEAVCEADGSKTLNDAASELRNTAFNSVSAGKFGFDNFANAGEVSGEVGRTFSSPQNSNLTFKTNATDLVAYKNLLLEKNFAALSLRNAVGEATRFCKWLAKVGAWEGDAEWLEHFKAGKNEGAAKEIGVVLNVEQVKKLLEWLSVQEDENFKVLFNYLVIAFNTGARTGEILALKITDFNFESQKVTFNKTVVSRRSGSVSHNTKTGASRSLQVSVSVLEAAKRQMQLSKSSEGFLFTNKSRQTFENGTTLSGFYYKACKAALGVTNTRLYNTRHAFVTNSINRDFNNVAAVSKIVGHAKISTTLDNYYATAGELNAAEVSPF